MTGRVAAYIEERLASGPLHFTLIDPEKSDAAAAAELARGAVDAGTDAILLGGSTGISPERMGAAARAVRKSVPVPAIIFPEGPGSISPDADAILFMSLLNSRNPELLVRAQARAAVALRRLGLETLALGYLVVAPGMRVGQVGEADLLGRSDREGAQGYALAAELFGMRFVYLEAGSGAPEPVPAELVRAVREVLSVPLIVGGGIRTGADAGRLLEAGAQILVTGTVAEEEGVRGGLTEILREVNRRRGR
ncbi:MAG: phosphoglycerol geranylgeranyltransferase [Thermoplasmata archaeon]